MTSARNPMTPRLDRSPTFGGEQRGQEVTYTYVQNEEPTDIPPTSGKPNNVTLAEYTKALDNNRHDLKMIARFEVERANRKVERATN